MVDTALRTLPAVVASCLVVPVMVTIRTPRLGAEVYADITALRALHECALCEAQGLTPERLALGAQVALAPGEPTR